MEELVITEGPMNTSAIIGVDLAKNSLQLFGGGKLQRRIRRSEVIPFFAKIEPATIGLEACSGSHFWGRELKKLGHDVRLMPPQYVKAYVKRNKNDNEDAEACWEAVQRPNMRFVPIKQPEQQAALQLHRERERLVGERTKVVNQAAGFLLEFGIVLPTGVKKFPEKVRTALERHEEQLPPITVQLVSRCVDDFLHFNQRVEYCEELIKAQLKEDTLAQKLDTIAGVGAIIATAARAYYYDITGFKNGRHFAASLGLTPTQRSTGLTVRLGKISKRGNPYLRKLLVQGAHAVLNTVSRKDDPHSKWLKELVKRRGRCKAAVALANKNARIIYAILSGKSDSFSPELAHMRVKHEGNES